MSIVKITYRPPIWLVCVFDMHAGGVDARYHSLYVALIGVNGASSQPSAAAWVTAVTKVTTNRTTGTGGTQS